MPKLTEPQRQSIETRLALHQHIRQAFEHLGAGAAMPNVHGTE